MQIYATFFFGVIMATGAQPAVLSHPGHLSEPIRAVLVLMLSKQKLHVEVLEKRVGTM